MHFAHRLGSVAGLAKNRGEGGGTGRQRAMVIPSLVLVNGQTAQQRIARRSANREGAETVVEAHAIGGERINVRRSDFFIAVGAQAIDAVLICMENQDMERFWRNVGSRSGGREGDNGAAERYTIQFHDGSI
jgi:hypothetical protein